MRDDTTVIGEPEGEAARMQGDLPTSIQAYEKAIGLVPANARLYADYAEVLAMAQGGDFKGKPTEVLKRPAAGGPSGG